MTSSPSISLSMNPGFIIDASLSEIIGRAGIAKVLELVRMSQVSTLKKQIQIGNGIDLQPLESALDSIYGNQVGAGIAFRVGTVSFKYFLSVYGEKLGFFNINFRLLPINQKILEGLTRIGSEIHSSFGLKSTIRDHETNFAVEIKNCFECNGEKASQPTCHFIAGFLQESMAWIGGGRFFSVKESSCMASGASCCTFELSKRPID